MKPYLLLWIVLSHYSLMAQQIENVRFQQQGDQVLVTYDITGSKSWQTFDVRLYISENAGHTYEGPLRAVSEDVGSGVKGGYGKQIYWNVFGDRKEVIGKAIRFKVEATLGGKSPRPDGMVLVEGGTFQMGDVFNEGESDEKPVHTVTVSSFYMSRYEVSNAEYAAFLNAKGNQTEEGATWLDIANTYCRIEKSGNRFVAKSGYANHPVVEVTWYGAKAYCNWRTEVTGQKHRLPTEAEWEFAARERGRKVRFGNGKNIANPSEMNFDASANYKKSYSVVGEYRSTTVPVHSFSPNVLGLYNMSGNVWEWCEDYYNGSYYQKSEKLNPNNKNYANYRVLRGGSWGNLPLNSRVAYRSGNVPNVSSSSIGFRCIRVY